jgi:long-chain-fatty-acid--CoA ligase ACSBG
LKAIVQWSGNVAQQQGVYSWEAFISYGAMVPTEEVLRRISMQKAEQCCTLIYTSGTTGPPKAVMLSHDNITWTAACVTQLVFMNRNDVVVSFLPLSHVAAQMIDIYGPLTVGCSLVFAQPDALKGTLGDTLKEVRPTIFFGVPRVWEKIEEKMRVAGSNTRGMKKRIADWAKAKGLEGNYSMQQGRALPGGWKIANLLVYEKVKHALGLDRTRIMLSGAAPISRDTLNYFLALNLPIMEVYGMSEVSGPQTIGIPWNFKGYSTGSVGKRIPGTVIKIDKPDAHGNGEICMMGRNVFLGYMKNAKATAESFDDEGFFHSGDVGRFDNDGLLHITGRIKELIITAGGENIPPVIIEDEIKKRIGAIVSNIMVVGDRKKFLSALITLRTIPKSNPVEGQYPLTENLHPDVVSLLRSLGSTSTTVFQAQQDPLLRQYLEIGINTANKSVTSNAQQVRKFEILSEDFTLENDLLTPSLKLKRRNVLAKYSALIDKMYEGDE